MASCITQRWKNAAPQMKLTVTQTASSDSTATLSWKLEYVAASPASTSGSNSWDVYIGDEHFSGAYNINKKTGTYTVDDGTVTVNKRSGEKNSIGFKVRVFWGLRWSGVYCGEKTASASIVIDEEIASSGNNVTYTVVKGDTLTKIAKKYNTTVARLVELNDIPNPDYIVVGQVLIVSGTGTGSSTSTSNSAATITLFGLQSNTDRTIYATWAWDASHTDNYKVMWYYDTGDGVWFVGNDSTVDHKQSTYSAPENAKRVRFKVKPISEKHKVDDKETSYWFADWSELKTYDFDDNPPKTPPVPTVEVDGHKVTVELDDLDVNAETILFEVVANHKKVVCSGMSKISTNHASWSCTLASGDEYKIRCQAQGNGKKSEWSGYSESFITVPATPSILTIRGNSTTSVYLEWSTCPSAKTYDIEYATKKTYFDITDKTTVKTGIEFCKYELTGLDPGEIYYCRVRTVNEQGVSDWSDIKWVIIGKPPAAPTTWSSTTTLLRGESAILYWVHNSEDGSLINAAQIEVSANGGQFTRTINYNNVSEEDREKTSHWELSYDLYASGAEVKWRVRTCGITGVYGDWSVQRTINVYAPVSLALSVSDANGDNLDTITSLPFYIYAIPSQSKQTPIGYHLAITSNDIYETVDQIGNAVVVNKGDEVYSKYFDITDSLALAMSAENISLEQGVSYTVTCIVTMNSGLNASASATFDVSWTTKQYRPNMEISVDKDTFSTSIRPYCEDEHGIPIDDVLLSVYRREFDGSFTELATDLDNSRGTFITDPHPALDYARYRIVAKSKQSGSVSYYDPPGYPLGGKAAIIQWSETWSNFDNAREDAFEQPVWSGSLLKLPYNIDVSDDHKPDVELVEYIGRSHPVSYYGTHKGFTSTWNMVIEKDDEQTLYTLRRLANWMGDVYVREPSGSGYWANVTVSFSQKHCELTIPVTLNITRVEGGA